MPGCRAASAARRLIRFVLLLIGALPLAFSLLVTEVRAESPDIRRLNVQIITDDDHETTKAIVADLSQKLPTARVIALGDKTDVKASNQVFTITIGPAALRGYLDRTQEGHILSAFTSSQAYRTILETAPSRPIGISAVYSEPAPDSLFQLISLLYKKPVKVAALLSDKTGYYGPVLQRAASRTGLDLTLDYVTKEEGVNPALNRLVGIPVVIAVPDSNIYNVENTRNILMTTYRRNQSLIGFSSALVKAGALASTSTNIPEINDQLVEILASFAATGKMPDPQFPKYFKVVINEDVAHSLNVVVDEPVRTFSNKSSVGPVK